MAPRRRTGVRFSFESGPKSPQPAIQAGVLGAYSAASVGVASATAGTVVGVDSTRSPASPCTLKRLKWGKGIVLLTPETWRRVESRTSLLPVTTAYWPTGVFLPVRMSSMQCPAVRTRLGAITVPVQLNPSPLRLAARMKAVQGHSSLVAVVPPTIEAVAAPVASAGAASASATKSTPRAPRAVRKPLLRTRLIAPLSAALVKSVALASHPRNPPGTY